MLPRPATQAKLGATELQGAAAPAAAAPDVAAAPAAAAQPDPIDLKVEAGKLRKELELLVAGSHIAVRTLFNHVPQQHHLYATSPPQP